MAQRVNTINHDQNQQNTLFTKGIFLVFLTAIISGVSIFLNSYAVKGFDSSVFTFSKNIMVALLLFTSIIAFNTFSELKSLSKRQWGQLAYIGLIGGSIPFLLFFKGLQLTTGTTSGFIHKTMFIWVGLLAIWMLKEQFNKWLTIGMFALLAGTWIMTKPDFAFTQGHWLVLGAVLFWAFENILAKKALAELSGTIVAWGRMFFGSLFILSFLAFTGKAVLIAKMSTPQYLWILLTSALLYLYVLTYYHGLKYTNATTASALLTLGAPITAVLSTTFSATHTIDPFQIGGMLLLCIGVICVIWTSHATRSSTTGERLHAP